MKRALFLIVLLAAANLVFAVQPATVSFMSSAGKGQGQCPGGVCSQWNTVVWVYNPGDAQASITVAFLKRDQANPSPPTFFFRVQPGQTREFADIMEQAFGIDGEFGALRFVSDIPVMVTGRIEDTNVQTNKGSGSAGQAFNGLSLMDSVGNGDKANIVGLAQPSSGANRSNFGFVEVTGRPCDVMAELLDGDGLVLANQTWNVLGFEPKQANIGTFGVGTDRNHQIRLSVTSGSGRILGAGSFLDNNTGDPNTSEPFVMTIDPADLVGTWTGSWFNTTFSSLGAATLVVAWTPNQQRVTGTVDLDGFVFGAQDPPAETMNSTFGTGGFRVNQSSPSYGAVDLTVSPWGEISGTLMNPASGIARVDITGGVAKGTIALRSVITFSGGGGTAEAYGVVQPSS